MAREITITDGTDTAEFVDGVTSKNFRLVEYRAGLPKAKRGGTFQASPLGRGRVPIMRQYENVDDALVFQVNDKDKADDQDDAIDELGTLLQLLMERAVRYWELPRQSPVYMTRKARNETGRQYALLVMAEVDGLPDLYGIEFDQIVMEDITIKLERFPWQSVIPGSAGAVTDLVQNPWQVTQSYEARLLADTPSPVSLWVLDDTSGTTAVSSIGASQNGTYHDQMLNDVPFLTGVPAAFIGGVNINTVAFRNVFNAATGTAMLWIRSSGGIIWTSGLEYPFFYVAYNSGDSIYLRKTTTNEQVAFTVTIDEIVNNIYLEGINTTEWLCFTISWNTGVDRMRLYMNGVLVGVYSAVAGTISGIISTAVIGSTTAGSGPGVGGDASHVTVWSSELTDTQVYAAYDIRTPPTETTDQGKAMVANARTLNNLTRIYTYDASAATFSSNLAYSTAFNLLPASLANGDILYLTRFDGVNGIPFSNAIFSVGTPGAGYTITWQYYNGSWVTLSTNDNTGQLKIAGINGVHWVQPSDWTTVAINGLTSYWVRGLVSGVSTPTTPTQTGQEVYTARLPYFELLDTAVSGDMSALARYVFKVQADKSAGTSPTLWSNRLIMGLRQYDDFELFTAFVNLSSRQNNSGITVTVGTNTTFTTDPTAPSGQRATFNPTGSSSLTARVTIGFTSAASTHYTGRFHAFLRCKQVNGSVGDIGVQLRVLQGTVFDAYQQIGDVAYVSSVGSEWQLLDLGEFVINPDHVNDDLSYITRLAIFASSASGTPDLYMYDLILMPVDEWYGDFVDGAANPGTGLSRLGGSITTLDIDAVENARAWTVARVRGNSDLIHSTWDKQALNGEPVLLNGQRQRLWCLWGRALTGVWTYDPEIVNSIQVLRADRWLGHRGSR